MHFKLNRIDENYSNCIFNVTNFMPNAVMEILP